MFNAIKEFFFGKPKEAPKEECPYKVETAPVNVEAEGKVEAPAPVVEAPAAAPAPVVEAKPAKSKKKPAAKKPASEKKPATTKPRGRKPKSQA